MRQISTFCLFLLLSLAIFLSSRPSLMAQLPNDNWLNIEHLAMPAPTFVLTQKSLLGMSINDDLRPTRLPERDELGYTHLRYRQTYRGIPVEGATLLLHERDGMAYLANGALVRRLQADNNAALSPDQALQRALAHVNGQRYAWQDAQMESTIKELRKDAQATFYPSSELVWVAPLQAGKNAQAYRLAYKLDIYALQPLKRAYVYIDAQNGNVIEERQLLHDVDVAATGNDAYSCSNPVNITADNTGSFYRLRETQRGGGIHTYTAMNMEDLSLIDITDFDTHFDSDPTAVSAHRCTEATYDYFKNTYNRNSIDGNGYQLNSWVHYGTNYDGAGWDGNFMLYGDGGTNFMPLASPDVVAHEITHGLTQFTANLTYQYESGALNESFSDIFGTVIEFEANAACADWIIGGDITLTANGLRSMSNPNDAAMLTRCPDTYGGNFWHTGGDDAGGIHTNSGVQNFWFYLLSNGGTGTNDNGDAYNVGSIGMDKAARIAYRNLSTYLISASQYADARAGSIQAATDLYGAGSNEVAQVIAAWCAVGVGSCSASSNGLSLTAPNGGEIWLYNSNHNITWTTNGSIPTINIDYSIDGGATWNSIAANLPNTGSYAWTVPNVGSPQAKVRVSSSLNTSLQDMSNAFFTIQGCDVVAGFSSAATVCQNTPISFTNASSGTGTFTYTWQVNGTTIGTAVANLTYSFATAGTFIVSLTASNGACSNTYEQNVVVNAAANAAFTHTQNTLSLNVFAVQNDVISYSWDFGDGTTATTQNAAHTYTIAGAYNVCLITANSCNSNMLCENITLNNGNCEDTWKQYTNSNSNLPNSPIYTIATDATGNKWIGTANGVAKFDGITWTVYNTANSGLPDDDVRVIKIDAAGNKWIGTYGGGVAKFDGTTWTVYHTLNSGLPATFVLSIAIDTANNKWIGTNSGIAKFDGTNWTIYNNDNSGLPNDNVSAIAIDAAGNKWIGTDNGVAKFDGTVWTTYNTSNSALPHNNIFVITIDAASNKWIGTNGGGLAKFDGTVWTTYHSSNSGLPNNDIRAIVIDAVGNKWIGTNSGGVAKFDNTTWTIYNTSNSALPSNYIYAIAIDNDNNKWIGVYEGGVAKFDGIFWTAYNASNSGLPNNDVQTIATDAIGNKWIGTNNGGLAKFDGTTWTTYNTSNSGLPHDDVRVISIDAADNKWIGTYGGGVAKFDGTTWNVYHNLNSDLPTNFVRTIAIDAAGNKWIGTNSGMAKFDGTTWTIYNSGNSSLPDDSVLDITIDVTGIKWVGTFGGVAKFDGTTWTVYNTANSDLPNSEVRSIAIDAAGNKWIATWQGLAKFDGTIWTIYNNTNSGLPSNYLYTITIDNEDNKWIGAYEGGVTKFDGTTWTTYNTTNSGLTNNNVYTIAIDAVGNKWAGTEGGVAALGCSTVCAATALFDGPQTNCSNTPITFTNTSINATTYQWKVNSTNVSTATDLTYTFPTPGTYIISLEASSNTCTDIYTQNVSIELGALSLSLQNVATCGASTLLDCGIPNALTYTWNFGGTLISNNQTLNATQSGNYTLSVVDACGNVGFDSLEVLLDDDCVYPGDFNYDGLVDHYDLLYWGWAAGSSGSMRPNASLVWEHQPCYDWANTQQNGTNYKHADGNGNGIIDNNDPQAIVVNYGQTQGTAPAVGNTSSPLSISPIVNQAISISSNNVLIYIDLYLINDGNTSATMYGTAFKANYSFPATYHVNNAYLDFSGSWLGTDGINMRSVQKNFINANNNGGYIEVAVSRNNHQNATGSSKVATLIAEVDVVNSGSPIAAIISATNGQVSLANGNIMGISNSSNMSFSLSPTASATGLLLQPTVWLNGAYNSSTGLMNTALRNNNLLPLHQPYHAAPYNYTGTESVATLGNMPANAVDWVLVELRSADNMQQNIARKAALLLSNGSIVDADGISNGLRFPTTAAGNYYVVIRHRNHVDIISSSTISLGSGTPTSINLGDAATILGGTSQAILLGNGQYALKSGDFDGNGVIQVSDFNLFSGQTGSINQYRAADCNLDGHVTIADFNAYILNPSAVGVAAIRY